LQKTDEGTPRERVDKQIAQTDVNSYKYLELQWYRKYNTKPQVQLGLGQTEDQQKASVKYQLGQNKDIQNLLKKYKAAKFIDLKLSAKDAELEEQQQARKQKLVRVTEF